MENLLFSLNAVAPVFIMVFLGAYMCRKAYLDKTMAAKLNQIILHFAMPMMFFYNLATVDFRQAFRGPYISFMVGTTMAALFISWIIAMLLVKDRRQIGVFVQGVFNGNYVFLGLPLIANILGGDVPQAAYAVTTFAVPLYNIFSVIVLSIYGGEKKSIKETAFQAVKNVAKNPLIQGLALGAAFSLLRLPLPGMVGIVCGYMSGIASPLALLSMGATLSIGNVRPVFPMALLAAVLKMVVLPLIFIFFALKIGIYGEELVVLYVMYAVPTAVSSYPMAAAMGGEAGLASGIVVVSSFCSILTFTGGIMILRTLGLI